MIVIRGKSPVAGSAGAPVLWQALWTWLRLRCPRRVIVVQVLTMMLLWSSRELGRQAKNAGGPSAGDERHV